MTWSRIERRFNGTWREGEDRFGELSIRLVDGEIRGALTTDARSKINPATPRLADVVWTRADVESKPPTRVAVPPILVTPRPVVEPTVIRVRDLNGAEGAIHSLMLSKDAKLLYASTGWPLADHMIRVWDIATGKLVNSLADDPDNSDQLVLSPDGTRFLARCGKGKRIVMWDAKTNTPLKTFSANKESISAIAWANDGKRFVTGSEDKHVRLWDVDSGENLWDGVGHVDLTKGAAFLPGDKQILSADQSGKILLWDVATGKSTGFPEFEKRVLSVNFAMPLPDGKRILVGTDQFGIWDLQTSKKLVRLRWHRFGTIHADISPDGKYVVTGAYDGVARLFDARTGRLIQELRQHDGYVWVVKFALDSRTFFSAAGGTGDRQGAFAMQPGDDRRVHVWRIEADSSVVRSGAAGRGSTASKTAPTKIEPMPEKFAVDFRTAKALPAEIVPRTAACRQPGTSRCGTKACGSTCRPVARTSPVWKSTQPSESCGDFDVVATFELGRRTTRKAEMRVSAYIALKLGRYRNMRHGSEAFFSVAASSWPSGAKQGEKSATRCGMRGWDDCD